jgi:hypothetical protein
VIPTDTSPNIIQAIKDLQCSGCVSGSDPRTCDAYQAAQFDDGCAAHCAGTTMARGGRIHLGMPKGFDKVGALHEGQTDNTRLFIDRDPSPAWNHLNVPIWYRYDGTYTYVRTFCPRVGVQYIDAFIGDRTADVLAANPSAHNVAEFESEID